MSGAEPGITAKRSQAFRERAMLEADRYGPDPWIFVRELLQNSRDAGGTAVDFTIGNDKDTEWVCCYDDGEGMTFEHARRYLFALYASSKEDNSQQAGKFGVGFWSVLRFSPITITIRSRPRSGEAWGLQLDGNLEHAERVSPPQRFGTEVILTRASGDGRLSHRILDAVRQSARYLRMRDQPDRPLPIRISGRLANEEFSLPAPSASFRRKHVRGCVGLGSAPRVELFSRGLRVRSAACLEDLAAPSGRHTARMRVQFPELPGGLAPTALLESDALEVMLSRSDARDNRALTKLVRLAQKELERLIDSQLAHARPQPWWRRSWDRASAGLRNSLAARTFLGAGLGAVAAAGISLWLWGGSITAAPIAADPRTGEPAAVAVGPAQARPYADLGQRYRGPRVDVLSPGSAEPVDLRYSPKSTRLHFAALTLPTLSADGSPVHEPVASAEAPYATVESTGEVVDVSLPVVGTGTPIRIPVPTGHRIVTGSVSVAGEKLALRASGEGHPTVTVPKGARANLQYQTTAALDPDPVGLSGPLELPPRLAKLTQNVATGPIAARVRQLLSVVRADVKYDRAENTAARHTSAVDRGQGFIQRTLDIGAGDCDVQNGLLVALLQSANVRSRLAVGYIGIDGRTLPWLHAWAEYLGDDGRWHIADASEGSASAQDDLLAVAGPPSSNGKAPKPSRTGRTRPPPTSAADSETADPETGGLDADDASARDPARSQDTRDLAASAVLKAAAPTKTTSDSLRAWLVAVEARRPWLLPGGTSLLLLLAIWGMARGRTFRNVNLDDSTDLSRLLQGVLQQPGAFSHMASLFSRPLVPLIDGRALSLQRTRELATKGRLYRTAERPPIAVRAANSGAAVLDGQSPEGRTVADAVGAVDLDGWAKLFDQARTDPLANALNLALRRQKEPWRLRIGSQVPGRLASLELGPLGMRLPGDPAPRLVLIDACTPWWDEAAATFARRPKTAVFRALDQLAERLDIPEERRAPLLADGAKAALLESHGA